MSKRVIKWSGEVETKEHPPEGLFASGSATKIVNWLEKNHASEAKAMDALNFYINRAGENLPAERKKVLERVKRLIHAEVVKEHHEGNPSGQIIEKERQGTPWVFSPEFNLMEHTL